MCEVTEIDLNGGGVGFDDGYSCVWNNRTQAEQANAKGKANALHWEKETADARVILANRDAARADAAGMAANAQAAAQAINDDPDNAEILAKHRARLKDAVTEARNVETPMPRRPLDLLPDPDHEEFLIEKAERDAKENGLDDGDVLAESLTLRITRKMRRVCLSDAWDAMEFAVRELGQLSEVAFHRFDNGDIQAKMDIEAIDDEGNMDNALYTHFIVAPAKDAAEGGDK